MLAIIGISLFDDVYFCCMEGLREWFAQTDDMRKVPRIPMMVNMTSESVSSKKDHRTQDNSMRAGPSLDQMHATSRHSTMLDEESEEDEDFQIPEPEQEVCIRFNSCT